ADNRVTFPIGPARWIDKGLFLVDETFCGEMSDSVHKVSCHWQRLILDASNDWVAAPLVSPSEDVAFVE
ncbi:MAG: hypothetical protein AAF742_07010, partial [Pseudomonadota bacterium]